jgi:MFS family permease
MPFSTGVTAQIFSAVGHLYVHFFMACYFVIVLALPDAFDASYGELIGLWTVGSLLVGAGALPAGWLGDRWSARGMMAVFFVGIGAASVATGFAPSTSWLFIGLTAIGLFASIYHPVGIAWLVRNCTRQGKALALNGMFGNIGVSAAAVLTGALIDVGGWRAAFILPGAISIATGIAFLAAMRRGRLVEGDDAARPTLPPSRAQMARGLVLLAVAMVGAGLVYQATQAALPKLFEERIGDWLGEGALGVGAAVGAVYGLAGLLQYAGGHAADRYPVKSVYAAAFFLQVPLLAGLAGAAGLPLLPAATLAVVLSTAMLPAENILLARFTPDRHRGLAYGVKFVISFGVAPLAIQMVSFVHDETGGFALLFVLLAAFAAASALAAFCLPSQKQSAPRPAVAVG